MKINLNFQFKTLSGKEFDKLTTQGEVIEAHHAAKCLASTLFYASDKNLKFSLWAQELYKTSCLEIDETDLDILIAWIENYVIAEGRQITNPWFAQNGIKTQVIDSLKKQKEKQKK